MEANKGDTEHESRDEDGTDTGEKNDEDRQCGENRERLEIGEGAAEENERAIRRAEEIEECPGSEKAGQGDERERIGEERHGEDERNDGVVVDTEVGEILADAEGGIGEGFRFGECGAIGELRPGTALREAVAEGFGEVVDEGAEGGGGGRGVGSGRCDGGGCRRGVGDGEDGWRGGGHGCLL